MKKRMDKYSKKLHSIIDEWEKEAQQYPEREIIAKEAGAFYYLVVTESRFNSSRRSIKALYLALELFTLCEDAQGMQLCKEQIRKRGVSLAEITQTLEKTKYSTLSYARSILKQVYNQHIGLSPIRDQHFKKEGYKSLIFLFNNTQFYL